MKTSQKGFSRLMLGKIFLVAIVILISSCVKEKPTVITEPITDIKTNSATSGGEVIDDGNEDILGRGVCWNTSSSPTLENCLNHTMDGVGIGKFTSNITGLSEGSTYYVRAYATNSEGTGYGEDLSIATKRFANAMTGSASTIGVNMATLNGTVNPNGESTVVTFEYGTTTSYGSIIPATQSPVSGTTTTDVSANVTNLTEGTEYHYIVKAENSLGEKTGTDQSFITKKCPTATTNPDAVISFNQLGFKGTVNPNGESTVVTFEYGTTTSYGSTTVATESPVSGTTTTDVSANVSGLALNTTYHYRVKAESSFCTDLGEDCTATTKDKKTVALSPDPIVRLCPGWINTAGSDRDFGGHGPVVFASAEAKIMQNVLYVHIRFHAKETTSNYTECNGEWLFTLYTPPTNYFISDYYKYSSASYTDSNHDIDYPVVSGDDFVQKFIIMGDTEGNDVGNCTTDDAFLTVVFNLIHIEIHN
ncbi:MAG: hypothetical protein MUO72_01700 [Bacteroidales bacterium]|nr:hypothetical protein [Bacteroidales bacterium]